MSTLAPMISLASQRLAHQTQNVSQYLVGAQPRHDRLSDLIRATAKARAQSREDVSLCIELNNMAQGIIDRADEALTEQLERRSEDTNGALRENAWSELKKVKVQCLRLEHMFHVVEGLLGEE
jgi:ribosomal 50S subunit-associated protein YjgA (DUF615 family)